MESLGRPQVIGAGGGVNSVERERLVKSNILYIDGRDLHRSRMLEYTPLGRNTEEKAQENLSSQSSPCGSNSLLSRYVLEVLVFLCSSDSRFYSRRFGVPANDYRKALKDYNKVGIAGSRPQPYTIEQTIWYVVKRQYRFQIDSLYNQLEDVCVSILNLSLNEAPPGSPVLGPEVLLASLDEYHSRLFANYYKWCDYLGAAPFPWREPPWLDESFCAQDAYPAEDEAANGAGDSTAMICSPQTRQELQQMMFEVATFKLLWAEAANLRHTPELLCWLFHWLCLAWDKKYKPEEDFIDLIRDVIQRIRDEQWYMASSLRTPDHNARLIYDDFNELFWSRQCLDILDRFTRETEGSEPGTAHKVQMSHHSADTESFSDHQHASNPTPKTQHKMDRSMGLSVSRETLNAVVAELSCASKPGSGVKTFVEHRTYAQVATKVSRKCMHPVCLPIRYLWGFKQRVSQKWERHMEAFFFFTFAFPQIFFLLFGAFYGSIDGYIRRVGYITNCRKIQQRLLPMLPLTAVFRLPGNREIDDKGPFESMPSGITQLHGALQLRRASNVDRYCRRGFSSRMPTSAHDKPQWCVPPPTFALSSTPNDFRGLSVQYANTTDPYVNMVPRMMAHSVARTGFSRTDDAKERRDLEAMKRFGFLWNEIIQSWRDEDIICYAEQEKLEFNELPRVLLETNSLADLYLGRGGVVLDWRQSVVRHPVYVYCNELSGFLKSCEDFHFQASGDMLRLCSKQQLARTFYREHLSTDPSAKDPRFEKSMHLQACQEVAEALMLYLSRYFKEGSQLVWAMEELWSWVVNDCTRLLWLNLKGLRPLSSALQDVFSLVQRTTFLASSDAESVVKANAQLKKALLAMIMLPSSEPEELGGSNIPLPVQQYVKAVSVCFGSDSMIKDIPSILPAPLQRAEVAVMIEQLEIILQHTSLLLLANLPLLPEELAEMRALHAQLGEANASVVLANHGSEFDPPVRDPEESRRIASAEHGLRMFFRRAARILKADDPSFKCTETQRRFGTFINSLLMKIPETPLVRNMVSMMTLTPYYREDTRLDLQDLEKRTDEGVCKMDLLRSLHPVEFDNFIERVDRDRDMFTIRQEIEDRVTDSPERRNLALQDIRTQMQQCGLLHRYDRFCEMLQEWASYRGQAYIEETPAEELHLCRDSNRLDASQLGIVRSPEGALWKEVVSFAPPYEMKQSTRELSQLKYQYVVAAQEFGTDLGAQPPAGGCEPSPLLRAQLLRKVSVYKLLVRYPSLRIATLEHERTPDGRPTGHKLSVLYRLTADIDPTGKRISSPDATAITEMKTAGRFVRSADGELLPAHVPNLLVPSPRLPVCTPGANMGTGSTVTIKPRCGGSSSGGGRSGEAPSSRSSKSPTDSVKKQGLTDSAEVSYRTDERIATQKAEGDSAELRHAESRHYIRTTIVEGTRRLLKEGFISPEASERAFGGPNANESGNTLSSGPSASPATPQAQAKSNPFLPARYPSKGAGDIGTRGSAGDFESKIARAIHWLRQKRECDRSLFAARTKTTFRYTPASPGGAGNSNSNTCLTLTHPEATGRAKKTFLSMLRQGLPNGPGAKQMEALGSVANSLKETDRIDTLVDCSGDSGSAGSSCIRGLQAEVQLSQNPVHTASPLTPLVNKQISGYFRIASEGRDCEYPRNLPAQLSPLDSSLSHRQWQAEYARLPSFVPDSVANIIPQPTLLEAQFARELARDCMGPIASTGPAGQLQETAEPLVCCSAEEKQMNRSGGLSGRANRCTMQTRGRPTARQWGSSNPTDARNAEHTSGMRRHSIITLHPRQETSMSWNTMPTLDSHRWKHVWASAAWPDDSVAASNREAVSVHNQTQVGTGLHPSRESLLHRHDASHQTEFQASSRVVETNGAVSRQDNNDRQASQRHIDLRKTGEKQDGRTSSSSTAAQRSNSVGALRDRGLLTMKERVAFFEEKLSRHQARMELEAQNLVRHKRSSTQEEMLWPSRRGPMRLEAIYKIRLPLIVDESGTPWGRAPIIGPGKPENQNHAIAFSRMDTMQVMDMNMESYLEEAMKLRNLLQEFALNARMRILGFREHIFTENVSSLASYMALQENLFTTTNQRLYFTPLRVRMHYGHPDIFDRFFVQTCGSCSKASNGINLSEDIFAGFNCTARGYCVHHADYIQCGKGRDVGLQQVVMFEKKVAGGNGEQVLSRDLNRLVLNMDFFRVLSLWFTGPGFFLNSVILVLAAYVCLYTKCFLAFAKYNYNGPIESALEYVLTPSTYVQFQLGMLLVLPLIPWLFLEKGLGSALRKLLDLTSKFSVTYYNFMTCTKASVVDHVLIYGGAKYQETGRGFVIERATLKEIWMFFYFTHFSIGLEMFVLLIIYATYAGLDVGVFLLDTWPILLMASSINSVPFIFNPLGFYYPRLRQDFTSWNAWLSSQELGTSKESWVSWWRGEMEQRCNIIWHHKVIIVLRLLRFPLLAAGITSCVATSIQSADVDCAVYLVAASGLFATIKALLGDLQMLSPSIKAWLSLLLVTGTTALLLWLVITKKVSLASLVLSLLALCLFIYGALEIAFALLDRWAVRSEMLSDVVRMYHRWAGFCTFAPLLVLSAVTTSVHHLQTRILFNPTFVSIVKSGLVQREQVEKSGRGHS
ncbi:1,3-beta-glucan synthase component domain-containing protein, putative [Eimeria brunetti]|uniref:1,3-beta-glucan synthase n=1 Tax=Eimeria brunetti TaxID=51314 RepID=U6LNA4_9EIME|nr:1,3-beta-glucan synthase component domain-containing protein, putative [Eimeria brunetti]